MTVGGNKKAFQKTNIFCGPLHHANKKYVSIRLIREKSWRRRRGSITIIGRTPEYERRKANSKQPSGSVAKSAALERPDCYSDCIDLRGDSSFNLTIFAWGEKR